MPHPFDQMDDVWEWAPSYWHWEVSPVGVRSLVRNSGHVIDPNLLWRRLCGPGAVQREVAPKVVVCRRIREEDEHIRYFLYLFDRFPNRTWSIF
jgi:hypothetical protein